MTFIINDYQTAFQFGDYFYICSCLSIMKGNTIYLVLKPLKKNEYECVAIS